MGLFFAYAKNVNDDCSYRYIITFASRSVADEWWRAVSTCGQSAFTSSIDRVAPQFYTHNPITANIVTTITTSGVAQQFMNKMFFTLLNNRDALVQSFAPPQPITDHINGSWYYIRSKRDCDAYYWHVSSSGAIVASKTQSTRFYIVSSGTSACTCNILIGSDKVYLNVGVGLHVKTSASGNLLCTVDQGELFSFSDLTNAFRVNAYGTGTIVNVASNAIIKTTKNDAEEWELAASGLVGGCENNC